MKLCWGVFTLKAPLLQCLQIPVDEEFFRHCARISTSEMFTQHIEVISVLIIVNGPPWPFPFHLHTSRTLTQTILQTHIQAACSIQQKNQQIILEDMGDLSLFFLHVLSILKAVSVTWTCNSSCVAWFMLMPRQAMPKWLLVTLTLNITQQTIISNEGALLHILHLTTAEFSTDHLPQLMEQILTQIRVANSIFSSIHNNVNISKTLWCEVAKPDVVCKCRK